MNCKRKSRRRFFLLMQSRTSPISSEFRGGGGLNTLNPPSVRHCRPGFPITDGSQYYPAGHEIFHCCWSPIFVRTYHICKSTPLERVASSWTFHSPFLQIPDLLSLFRQNSGFQIRLFPWALRRNLYRCRFPCEHCVKSISSFSTDPNEEKALNMGQKVSPKCQNKLLIPYTVIWEMPTLIVWTFVSYPCFNLPKNIS